MANGVLTIPLAGSSFGSSPESGAHAPRLPEFIAGPENALAATAFEPLLNRAPHCYSPLVLYGPRSCGKSHLARGLADWWRRRDPAARVQCHGGAEFAGDLAAAVAEGRLDAWREQMRGAELLVLDDLGELTDKRPAQQELLHVLDALADRQAMAVITARSLPSHWPAFLAALRGRLSAGLAVGLAFPAQASRRAILERLLELRGLSLAPPAINRLAGNLQGGVPALLAAILDLELNASVEGQPVDHQRVRQFVAAQSGADEPSIRQIAALTAKYFGLKLSELKSPVRRRPLVVGRGVAMYLARQLTSNSLEQIGSYFGGRDHTTVIYGCRRTENLLRRDRAIRQAVAELKNTLTSSPRTP